MPLLPSKNSRHTTHHRTQPRKVLLRWVLGLIIVLWLALPSQAHWADLAVADIIVEKQTVDINLTIPTGLLAQFDDDKNQQLALFEVNEHQLELQKVFAEKIRLTVAGQENKELMVKAGVVNNLPNNLNTSPTTHSNLLLKYQWAAPIQQLQMHYELFAPGITTARCLAQVRVNNHINNVVFTPAAQNTALINAPIAQQITSFIGLGIEHIWTGFDHILFLISLLMLGGELGYLLKIVTAFSVSHSFTLFLAALNIISVPSRWVEIAIALSIAYIAAENLWRKQPQARWQMAFGFGLIHGLGFSSALQELDLPRTNLVTSLASFSVGIELGQFAIVLVVYLLLSYLRKFSWNLTIRRSVSGGIIVMSLIWFWERAFIG